MTWEEFFKWKKLREDEKAMKVLPFVFFKGFFVIRQLTAIIFRLSPCIVSARWADARTC